MIWGYHYFWKHPYPYISLYSLKNTRQLFAENFVKQNPHLDEEDAAMAMLPMRASKISARWVYPQKITVAWVWVMNFWQKSGKLCFVWFLTFIVLVASWFFFRFSTLKKTYPTIWRWLLQPISQNSSKFKGVQIGWNIMLDVAWNWPCSSAPFHRLLHAVS